MTSTVFTTMAELEVIVSELVARISKVTDEGATVLALHGDLGAGKTTLVQLLARTLGVTETVTSPTFVIMKQYATTHAQFETLVHIDAYRIETEDEMRPLRFADILNQSGTLVCVEWAERIPNLLPAHTVHVSLELLPDGSRTLSIS
jgi:tRNA threonylcarbamoyladenosine biosynthesis protein TsaE